METQVLGWRSMFALVVALAASLVSSAASGAPADKVARAAASYERGEKHYAAGEFEKALAAFQAANALVSHHSTLFNVGRCLENLGRFAKALATYRQLLAQTADLARREQLRRRIRSLARRPTRVFVTSRPPGATVTVDGRQRAERGVTPLVTELVPGEHVLLLRAEGRLLTAKRVVVAVGTEQTVTVELPPLPPKKAQPPSCPPCRRGPACPAAPAAPVDVAGLHLHGSLALALSFTNDRDFTAGPGVLLHVSYGRVIVGATITTYIAQDYALPAELLVNGKTYDRGSSRRILALLEGGYLWPWRHFYLHGVAGLGLMIDRAIFARSTDGEDIVHEEFAFAWNVGGGIEAFATPWLSFGAALRLGMGHGKRADLSDTVALAGSSHFFIGQLWATATFHL